MHPIVSVPPDYEQLLRDIKERISNAQLRAAVSVNRELILLYWEIGREILERQSRAKWGAKVIDRLAADLRAAFPEQTGFSPRNLKYMRKFAAAWTDITFVQQLVAQLPWGHQVVLLDRVDTPEHRVFYARRAAEHGWSRNVLLHQIDSGLVNRQGRAITNFDRTLPPERSDLARELLKSPYSLDFLTLHDAEREQSLERALIAHIRDFLVELGAGFAFVGQQKALRVGRSEYFLDLLFYHLGLRCFVVIELKVGMFEPEYAGKMSFYLAAVDDLMRREGDGPSLGIILCRDRDEVIVEYALRDMGRPIGVSTFDTGARLPDGIRDALPSVERLMAEVASVMPGGR
ncbi:PDDEXK nuclease domain-containing protein [Longimicrobium sp.]|uniref:PDDEXK nuclease domain-containing protein n=1 Tax=Longimicrobium sp. TaxID=2029185 RepID=UPI002CFBE85F|nr:PDDEXK nuclease domain-containing protein [Longimicrobium sp.]HSU12972.1 PDDEXK nuclease domain-containing protein [Longimicrobium sp.]